MVNCKKCYNQSRFVQYSATSTVKRRVTVFNGEIRTGAVQKIGETEIGREGLYCRDCEYKFTADLEELGIPKFGRTINDVASVEEIKSKVEEKISEDAEIHYAYFSKKDAEYKQIPLSDHIKTVLKKIGVDKLYSHQADAIESIRKGKNTVIQTKTSSGKSLCFQIPIIENLLERELKPTAIIIFPTKALAYDQMQKLSCFGSNDGSQGDNYIELSIGKKRIKIANLNGDTKDHLMHGGLCFGADIIITNPDFIHSNILLTLIRKNGSWLDFFRRLNYLVIDEVHQYRGVFGANTALLMRRISMLCDHLGSKPTFICCSATLSNPVEHAKAVTGAEFVLIDEDGAPSFGRHFFLLNPKSKEDGEPKEPSTVALSVLLEKQILFSRDYQVQTLVFGRSRRSVMNMFVRSKKVANRLHSELGLTKDDVENLFASFLGTYSETDRKEIIDKIKSKEKAFVFSTNALELGIDINSISCTLVYDYPGNSMSLLQQVGRSGRLRDSISFLIFKNEPLQQYFFKNPNYFMDMLKSLEPAVLNFDNKELLTNSLRLLKFEEIALNTSFSDTAIRTYFGENGRDIWQNLPVPSNEEIKSKIALYRAKGLRGSFSSFDIEFNGKTIGTIDELCVGRDLFKGAVWENNNGTFISKRIDYENENVTVEKLNEEIDFYTLCDPTDKIEVLSESKKQHTFFGRVFLEREFKHYYEMSYSNNKTLRWHPIYDVRPIQKEINAHWLKIQRNSQNLDMLGGVIGLRNLLSIWIPQHARCDRMDISCNYAQTDNEFLLFAYDNFIDGSGYSDILDIKFKEILDDCEKLVSSCDCENGCPKCLYLPSRFDNESINKNATLELIREMKKW